MNLLNEQINHIIFGTGKITVQEHDHIKIEFSEQYGTKMFVYPDAFDKFLNFQNTQLEANVHAELKKKQTQIEEEKNKKIKELEEETRRKNIEKLELSAMKKKKTKKA